MSIFHGYTGTGSAYFWLNPNLRNAEVGIALLFLLGFWKILTVSFGANHRFTVFKLAIFAFCLGLFFYNDPYFLYTYGLGIAGLTAFLWLGSKLSHKQALLIASILAASIVTMKILGKALSHFGFTAADNVSKTLLNLSQLSNHIQNTLTALFASVNGAIWGKTVDIHLVPQLLSAALLVACFGAGFYLLGHTVRRLGNYSLNTIDFYRLSLIATIIATIAVFLVSNNSDTVDTARYFFPLTLYISVLLADYISSGDGIKSLTRLKGSLLVLCIFSIGIGFLTNSRLVAAQLLQRTPDAQAYNYSVLHEVERQGITKGYTDYWSGNVNTYFSDRRILFLPTVCLGAQPYQFNWLINRSDFDIPAKKTFYLMRNNPDGVLGPCSANTLEQHFGAPAKTMTIENNSYTLFIYDFDIGEGLPQETPHV